MSGAEEWIRLLTGAILGGGLLTGIAALRNTSNSRRAGVAGDEREARRDEAAQRRDTIADRDAFIQKLSERVAQLEDAERENDNRITLLETERDLWHKRYDDEREYSRQLLDWGYRGAAPPPPTRPNY